MKTHECKIGTIRKGTMGYITPPRYDNNFRVDMLSIGATWGPVDNKGSWIFSPEHREQVLGWARQYFPVVAAAAPTPMTADEIEAARAKLSPREQYAIAMGLGFIPEEDLF